MSVKFAKQFFLNSAMSWDSGAIKLVVSWNSNQQNDIKSTFMLRDCTDQTELNFDVDGYYRLNGFKTRAKAAKAVSNTRKSINERRKKLRTLVNAINAWAQAMETALDEYEQEMDETLKNYEYGAK